MKMTRRDRRDLRDALCRAVLYVSTGWTQGALARDAEGRRVEPWDTRAVAWCLMGALEVGVLETAGPYLLLLDWAIGAVRDHLPSDDQLLEEGGVYALRAWNDKPGRTREDVLRLLDRILRDVMTPGWRRTLGRWRRTLGRVWAAVVGR